MKKEIFEKNLIVRLTFDFALDIIKYCKLLEEKRRFRLASQLLKSGRSIGANVWEAQHAERKNDFIHKFKIVAKYMHETEYWLLRCKYSEKSPKGQMILEKLESISKVINQIIASLKK